MIRHTLLTLSLASMFVTAGSALAQAPEIFFTDLTSAPNSGGETVSGYSGAYVTIYGNNFGNSQGSSTITWNGLKCLRVVGPVGNYTGWGSSHLWYQQIVVQIGAGCTAGTGNFTVTTAAGSSNGASFTVRNIGSNHIYFVSPTGSNSNSGSATSPFSTLPHCRDSLKAGDICYAENGIAQATASGFSALDLGAQVGTSWSNPVSIIAYPGARVVVGNDNPGTKGIEECTGYTPQCPGSSPHYIIVAGLEVHGTDYYAVSVQGQYARWVANKFLCPGSPNEADASGCFNTINSNETVLGNESYGLGSALLPNNAGKYWHQFYIGLGSNFDIGWNSSHDNNGGRLFQFYNGSGALYNINFHDNLAYNNVNVDCVTVDGNPDLGYVNIFNNVIYNCGQAPKQNPDWGDTTCLYLQNAGSAARTSVQVYNNTMYNCGAPSAPNAPAVMNVSTPAKLVNNILYTTATSVPYFASGPLSNISGSNNIYYGNGNGPSQTTANINANPQFVSAGANFALQATSPALNAGIVTAASYDINGVSRPQGSQVDVGAYELYSGGSPQATCNITVQSALDQSLGFEACSTANLASDGCTVVDVQRVVNYQINPAQGCRLGP